MGKRIIPQARGHGGPRYRTPSHRYIAKVAYFPFGNFTAKIVDIVNDPGHFTPIMLIKHDNKEVWHIAPEGVSAGAEISYGGEPEVGNVVELLKVPVGTKVSGIESYPGSGPKLCRSSGSFALVMGASGDKVTIKFPSGKEKIMNGKCRVMIGIPAGGGRVKKPWVKAGKKLHAMMARGKLYPRTVGVAMSPVDHPYGGRQKSAKFKTISRNAPPGRKIGSIAARRTGRKKHKK